MSASGPSCETCRFRSQRWKDGQYEGGGYLASYCRRYPQMVEISLGPDWDKKPHWCGEYVPTEAVAASASLDVVRHAGAELQAAGDSLIEAAKYLKDDGVGFRASRARQAGTRALLAADTLKDGQVPAFPA